MGLIEALVYFAFFTPIFSIIEVWYWDQLIRGKEDEIDDLKGRKYHAYKSVFLFDHKVYWKIHPLLPVVGIFLLSYNLPLSIGLYYAYTILQDIIYFILVRHFGSNKWYDNQVWMERFNGTDIPRYYLWNGGISIFFLVVALILSFKPILGVLGI